MLLESLLLGVAWPDPIPVVRSPCVMTMYTPIGIGDDRKPELPLRPARVLSK